MTGGRALCALLVACAAGSAAHAVEVPPLTGRVVDGAGILGGAQERLGTLLADHEARTTTQIAVLTIPTLGGEPIEEVGLRIANAWGLGQKARDNGVLVLVVPLDRRMRIEVGRGLEEALPDAEAKRILDEVMAPAFRGGDFAGGVERGVRAIIDQLDRYTRAESAGGHATDVAPPSVSAPQESRRRGCPTAGTIVSAFVVVLFTRFLRSAFRAAAENHGWSTGASVSTLLSDETYSKDHSWADAPWRSAPSGSSFDGGCASDEPSRRGSSFERGCAEGSSSSSWSSSSRASWSSSSFSSRSSRSSFSGGGGRSSGSGASGSW